MAIVDRVLTQLGVARLRGRITHKLSGAKSVWRRSPPCWPWNPVYCSTNQPTPSWGDHGTLGGNSPKPAASDDYRFPRSHFRREVATRALRLEDGRLTMDYRLNRTAFRSWHVEKQPVRLNGHARRRLRHPVILFATAWCSAFCMVWNRDIPDHDGGLHRRGVRDWFKPSCWASPPPFPIRSSFGSWPSSPFGTADRSARKERGS